MQTTTVPFHGEPVEGLQVMGILETRNLDFRHLLILSAQEGNMPRGASDTSFIPYSLRRAYGLTTPEHKVAIYSYYFHRLLQRADDVTIVYNNSTNDGQRGEMSRFLLQLMVEYPHPIPTLTLQGHISYQPHEPQPVPNGFPKLITSQPSPLTPQPSYLLTPTAINRYLRCPLSFHYYYVCGLRELDDPDGDTIDNRVFGNIFHEAARALYARMMEKSPHIVASDIDNLLKTPAVIERAVDDAFRQELFTSPQTSNLKPQTSRLDLGGLALINRQVIIHYLRQLLTLDQKLAPFTILSLEGDVSMPLASHLSPLTSISIGGRIDRMDMVTDAEGHDHIRVIDYKTGAHRLKPLADVDAVFSQESLKDHSDYYLQAMLYSLIVAQEHPGTPVSPALLFIQHAGTEGYDPVLQLGHDPISDIRDHAQRFTELLNVRKKLREVSIDGCPVIGGGSYSTVYRLDPETADVCWECEDGTFDDVLAKLPEAYRSDILILSDFILSHERDFLKTVDKYYEAAPKEDKKEFMLWVTNQVPRKYQGGVRNKYLNKPVEYLRRARGGNQSYQYIKMSEIDPNFEEKLTQIPKKN